MANFYNETSTKGKDRMKNRASILIVDDEPINIKVFEKLLCADYDIFSAQSGREAISQVKENHPDLILLDVMMPGLNGFETCRLIKADATSQDIPVIFVTAMDGLDGEIAGLDIGGIDYLSKPVNLDLLKLRVRNHIELKRRRDIILAQRDLLARQKEELEAALAQVKKLEGIIPICMYCKKIRDDQSSWQQLEKYISEHSEAKFSHGVCPDCYEKAMKNE